MTSDKSNEFIDNYIKELKWDEKTPDSVRTAVESNLRGFWLRVEASNTELWNRYNEARALVKRCTDGYYRDGCDDGETIDEAMSDALDWVSQEELEEEVFNCDLQ